MEYLWCGQRRNPSALQGVAGFKVAERKKGTGRGRKKMGLISNFAMYLFNCFYGAKCVTHIHTSAVKALSSRLAGPQSQVFFSGPLTHNTCAVSKPNPPPAVTHELRTPYLKRVKRPVESRG
jgi:hypothetical protein